MPDLRDDARELFTATTGAEPAGIWSAPGVVTLGGGDAAFVVAIDRRAVVAAGARDDAVLRIVSTWADEIVEVPLADLGAVRGRAGWAGPVLGVAWGFARRGADLAAVPGVDLVIESTVPDGLGLGSSTAVAVAAALALDEIWRLASTPADLARVVETGETEFAGILSRLADPVAALAGGAHRIDAGTGVAEPAEPPLGEMLVIETGSSAAESALAAETATEQGAVEVVPARGALVAVVPAEAVSRVQVAIDGAFAEHGYAAPEVFPVRTSGGATRDA